jgi:hypothetical protein
VPPQPLSKTEVIGTADIPDNTPPPEPQIIGYSEAEMQVIKEQAYQAGVQETRQEYEQNFHQALLERLAKLPQMMETLQQQQQAEMIEVEAASISLVTMMMRKLLPNYAKAYGLDEILAVFQHNITLIGGYPTLTVTCHPDIQDMLEDRVAEIFEAAQVKTQLQFANNDSMFLYDIALDWGTGGVQHYMMEALGQMVERSNRIIDNLNQYASRFAQEEELTQEDIAQHFSNPNIAHAQKLGSSDFIDGLKINYDDTDMPVTAPIEEASVMSDNTIIEDMPIDDDILMDGLHDEASPPAENFEDVDNIDDVNMTEEISDISASDDSLDDPLENMLDQEQERILDVNHDMFALKQKNMDDNVTGHDDHNDHEDIEDINDLLDIDAHEYQQEDL